MTPPRTGMMFVSFGCDYSGRMIRHKLSQAGSDSLKFLSSGTGTDDESSDDVHGSSQAMLSHHDEEAPSSSTAKCFSQV
jgi:hypothetical protein